MITTRPLIRAAATGEEARSHTQFGENLETVDERVSNWHVEIGVGAGPAAALHQRIAWAGAKWSLSTRRIRVRSVSTADHRRQGFSGETILPNCLVDQKTLWSFPHEWRRGSDHRSPIRGRDRVIAADKDVAKWLPNTPDQVKWSKCVSQIAALSIAPRTDSVGQQLCAG